MRTVKYIDVTNMTETELIELLENASDNVVIIAVADDEEEGGEEE
jgi:hypothetical protein